MAYQVTVTDGASAHAWVVATTSNLRTALRWRDRERERHAGLMTDVGVWDTSRDRWCYAEDEDASSDGN